MQGIYLGVAGSKGPLSAVIPIESSLVPFIGHPGDGPVGHHGEWCCATAMGYQGEKTQIVFAVHSLGMP